MRRKPTGGETAKKIDKRQDFDESVFTTRILIVTGSTLLPLSMETITSVYSAGTFMGFIQNLPSRFVFDQNPPRPEKIDIPPIS